MIKDEVMLWWNMMSFEGQFYKVIEYLSDNERDTTELHPHRMNFDEILEVYSWDNC